MIASHKISQQYEKMDVGPLGGCFDCAALLHSLFSCYALCGHSGACDVDSVYYLRWTRL